jgi:hypothetical protein
MSCYAASRFRHDHWAMLFCLSSCRNALAAITPELTGREILYQAFKLSNEK